MFGLFCSEVDKLDLLTMKWRGLKGIKLKFGREESCIVVCRKMQRQCEKF